MQTDSVWRRLLFRIAILLTAPAGSHPPPPPATTPGIFIITRTTWTSLTTKVVSHSDVVCSTATQLGAELKTTNTHRLIRVDYWKNVSSQNKSWYFLLSLVDIKIRHCMCAGPRARGRRGIGERSKGIFSIIFSIDQSRNGVTNLIDKLRLIY